MSADDFRSAGSQEAGVTPPSAPSTTHWQAVLQIQILVSILKENCKATCLLRARIPILFVLKQFITSLRPEPTFPTLPLVPTTELLGILSQKKSKAFSKIVLKC